MYSLEFILLGKMKSKCPKNPNMSRKEGKGGGEGVIEILNLLILENPQGRSEVLRLATGTWLDWQRLWRLASWQETRLNLLADFNFEEYSCFRDHLQLNITIFSVGIEAHWSIEKETISCKD